MTECVVARRAASQRECVSWCHGWGRSAEPRLCAAQFLIIAQSWSTSWSTALRHGRREPQKRYSKASHIFKMGEPAKTKTIPRLRLRVTASAETILRAGHPWLFAESIREQNREGTLGELAVIYDRKNQFLALGLFD